MTFGRTALSFSSSQMLGGIKMATVELTAKTRRTDHLVGTARAGAIDRWIYVFMAVFFLAITLTGFIPDAQSKIAAVQAHQRPPFPIALHFHAVLMGSYLLLLLAQTTLVATGRSAQHRKLGVLTVIVGGALVVVGLWLVPTMYHQIWNAAQTAPSPVKEKLLTQDIPGFDNIILLQLRIGILFPLLLALAVAARNTHPGVHKRLMILAITPALAAALDRITWLPTTLPASPVGSDLWVLAAVSPMFVWDVARNKSIHRGWWVFAICAAPLTAAVYLLWNTPWWHQTVHTMMGVG